MTSDYSVGRTSALPASSTELGDLPDDVLVEILSRLPSFELVFRSKLVCKLWGKLMSEPCFIGRFVLQQQRRKGAETQRGEAHAAVLLSKAEVVIGACNDLVLCCSYFRNEQHYKIYNPYTGQNVDLPFVFGSKHMAVGFICDPFYKKTGHNVRGEEITFDFNYRCKVVRIIRAEGVNRFEPSNKFRVDIFSFDTGEWRESIVLFPRKFSYHRIAEGTWFARNGMLYWCSTWEESNNFLIGLDPFVIGDSHSTTPSTMTVSDSHSTSCSDDDQQNYYRCRFIELGFQEDGILFENLFRKCLGVAEGSDCLQILVRDFYNTYFVLVWDLTQELITRADGVGKLCLKRYFPVDIAEKAQFLSFDPSIEGVLHAKLKHGVHGVVSFTQINFGSRSSEIEVDMAGKSIVDSTKSFGICVRSFWPTPVPRLPMREGKSSQVQHSDGVRSNSNLDYTSNRVLRRSSNIELGTSSLVMEIEKQHKEVEELLHKESSLLAELNFKIASLRDDMNQDLARHKRKKETKRQRRRIWGLIAYAALTLGKAALACSCHSSGEAYESDNRSSYRDGMS